MDPPRADRAAVFIVRDHRILLIHRQKGGEVYDAVPGGTVEKGESPTNAAAREVLEETGLQVTLTGPVLSLTNEGRREYYFDAINVSGEPVLGGPEVERHSPENAYVLGWVDIEDLAANPIRPDALRRWMGERDWSGVGRP